MIDKNNLTMLTDFYELTMANGYFENNLTDKIVYFDMFFRKIPDGGGFVITAGLKQVIEYIQNLKFTEEDIIFLKSKNIFSEKFLEYLKNFKFSCDVWAIPEGTPVFPNEPLLTIRGPIIEAQFIETMVLLTINHQSLITTKANRIVRAAKDRNVLEFGSRRAQGYDGAIYGTRAAYIGGCMATANTMADRAFNIPVSGTMAHSWIQSFDTELEAFRAYARVYPQNCTLLVDTYNTLKSGIPNAIKVFNKIIIPKGFRPKGIRIDSGDIAYLSKEIRKTLDEAGFSDCKIIASNSLDEFIIKDLLFQNAPIDIFGVGERLITAKSDPVFGGVYKLVAVEKSGEIIPRIKLSENVEKVTNPGFKKLFRLFDNDTNKALVDVIALNNEIIDEKVYKTFDQEFTWKKKNIENFYTKELQVQIFDKGELIYNSPTEKEIRSYCKEQVNTLWEEILRFENPHKYNVNLSLELWEMKNKLLNEYSE